MSVMYKGKPYTLVDVDYDETFIYDVLEDENGNRIRVISGYIS